ncbi:MAG TPA: hypothetical protein VE288_16290 [Rubrobacteraceae bacterium]|nr:hypothetical protein [Rubrobacteraceae bacterium]
MQQPKRGASVRTEGPQSTTSEDFAYELVGEVFDANELVAIVADKPVSEGTNTTVSGRSRRNVQAYVCDGEPQGDAEWFVGQTTANTLDLTSVSGKARLQAKPTEKEVIGTVTLANGTLHRFSALAARAGAGLY